METITQEPTMTVNFTATFKGETMICTGDAFGWSPTNEQSREILARHGRRAALRCKSAHMDAFAAACAR